MRGSKEGTSDFGVALALAGETTRAIALLETAAAEKADADTLSNLAAAHLLRATGIDAADDVFVALDYATHALIVQPRHAGALFNEALALSTLGLTEDADRDWRHYLELDQRSVWSEMARQQLFDTRRHVQQPGAQLEDLLARNVLNAPQLQRTCRAAAQACREQLEDVLLPDWGRAQRAGDRARAAQALNTARLLVEALLPAGDTLDAAALADLDRAAAGNDEGVALLARALDEYGRSRQALESDAASLALFRDAEALLDQVGNPLVLKARANRVSAEFNSYNAARMEALGPVFAAWGRSAASSGYVAVAGRFFYFAALSYANRSAYASAEPLYVESLRALEASEQRGERAATDLSMASSRLRIGDRRAGCRFLAAALQDVQSTTSQQRRYVALLNVGTLLATYHIDYAATKVLSLAIDVAVATARPGDIAEAALNRAKAESRIGALAAARADLRLARPDNAQPSPWSLGERAWNEYEAGLAEVESLADPQTAIDAATRALPFFEGRAFAGRVATLHLVRGRAYRMAGRAADARGDFDAGIATYEQYRRGLTSTQQRLASLDVVWNLYGEQLELAADDADDALRTAERGRARTMLEAMRAAEEPVSPPALASQLRPDHCVLYFALTSREVLLWAIRSDGVSFARVAIERTALARIATAFVDGVRNRAPRSDWEPEAEQLFDVLVEPVVDHLPPGGSIIVVPDGVLNTVPFAALVDRRSHAFVVESFSVTVVPSATVLSSVLHHDGGPIRRLLAAGNPRGATDSAVLTGAEREARTIAAFYPEAEALDGERATKPAFLAGLAGADVVHFAGHAVANPEYPLLAHLEFAADSASPASGSLGADEIAALRLTRPQLVVLAACETGVGSIYRGEGVLSLARPFLIAGVPSVIATLWDVSDEGAPRVVEEMHRRVAAGVQVSKALRLAQLAAMPAEAPAVWAAFVLVGNPGKS
jgi:CHAT domain-containing protein